MRRVRRKLDENVGIWGGSYNLVLGRKFRIYRNLRFRGKEVLKNNDFELDKVSFFYRNYLNCGEFRF